MNNARTPLWHSRARRLLAALVVATLCAGCDSAAGQSGLPVVKMGVGKKTYDLEVANTRESRDRGLMHRDSMPADHGMIFVFPDEAVRGFWMKNTRIPLDIIYLTAAGKVVSVHQMQPHDRRTTESKGPAQYAIELNQGEAAKADVKEGDSLALPKELPAAKE